MKLIYRLRIWLVRKLLPKRPTVMIFDNCDNGHGNIVRDPDQEGNPWWFYVFFDRAMAKESGYAIFEELD